MHTAHYKSPLGMLEFSFLQDQLVHLTFDQEEAQHWRTRHFQKSRAKQIALPSQYIKDLDRYFHGEPVTFQWPISFIGSPFQIRVWTELQNIPYGELSTYKKIAAALDSQAYRAVGQAVKKNPVIIAVPCHRVLGTHGFGGYSAGLNIKRLLLELEGAKLSPTHYA